jgi:hypothetical protein
MAKESGGDMAQNDREKPAVKTTIVGGRPPGSGTEEAAVPRGIEILLKKAAVDESFRKMLLSDRANAAGSIGLTLNPVETAMLKTIPESSLERMVSATKVQPTIRQAFMGYTAAVMLAALTAASAGMTQGCGEIRGVEPNTPQGIGVPGGATGGIRGDIVAPPSPPSEERQATQYKAESYMNIAQRDKNAPKGNLEVIIENWQSGGLNSGVFMKVHLTKTGSSTSQENSRTEGMGYARRGRFLQENIPVGEYLVEIAFAGQPYMRSKKITVKEKETASVSFRTTSADPTPGKITTKGITIDIQ